MAARSGRLELLPPELSRLFQLQQMQRDYFILRILAGFSPEIYTQLLDIPVSGV